MWFVVIAFFVLRTSTANIALQKPTYASSVYITGDSGHGNAVDGNSDPTWAGGSCALSRDADSSPWWMVDLLDDFIIHNITITNRNEYPERLHDFRIEVFTTNPARCPKATAQLCLQYDGIYSGSVGTFTCDSQVVGRFVRIDKLVVNDALDIMTMCEVEIQGTKQQGCPTKMYPKVTDARFSQTVSGTVIQGLSRDCAGACVINGSCVGFNYRKTTGQCRLILSPNHQGEKNNDNLYDYYGNDFC